MLTFMILLIGFGEKRKRVCSTCLVVLAGCVCVCLLGVINLIKFALPLRSGVVVFALKRSKH